MSGADDRYDALLCPAPRVGALRDKYASDVCLSVAYVGRKSRTERPRKTKIGTDVAYVTRDSDTTFKVKMSKVNLQEAGAYCGGLPHSLFNVRFGNHGYSLLPSAKEVMISSALVSLLAGLRKN